MRSQILLLLILVFGSVCSAIAQRGSDNKPDDLPNEFPRTRDLTNISDLQKEKSVFVFKKPEYRQKAVTKPRKPVAARKEVKTVSKTTSYKLPTPSPSVEVWKKLGLTIWRLKSPGGPANENAATLITRTAEYLPVRVSADTEFSPGDKVRLSFESPSKGYLYIIDRELYSDGTVGEPRLIFPSMLSRGGNNRIETGQMLDIPAQSDRVPFFTLESKNKDWRGELLTIIVSPEPLKDFLTPDAPSPVPEAFVSVLEDRYLKSITHYEQVGTEGRAYTAVEKEAGASLTRDLTQIDPYPQTMFKSKVRQNEPLLVNLSLKVK